MRNLFSILFFFAACFAATASAQEFKIVQSGIEHAQFVRQIKVSETETAPVAVNLLRLDLTKVRLDVVHAMDAAIGTEKTSSIAARYGAVAAINGGFFRNDTSIFRGDAAGVLRINGKLLSESFNNRTALGIINDADKTEIVFGRLLTSICLRFDKTNGFCFEGVNRERKNDDMVLFTPEFGRTTLTNPDGTEVIFNENLQKQIRENDGSSIIPANGFVVSVSGSGLGEMTKIRRAKKSKIEVTFRLPFFETKNLSAFERSEDIVGGSPQLVRGGVIQITWREEKSGEKFAVDRHPRTAVAKLKDGRALLATVDGRQPGVSVGMNLQELAEMLVEFGATDAMNLDGGGSTTMFLGGKVVNRPSDKEGERPVSDVLLVTLRN